jgi:hypothetical protein
VKVGDKSAMFVGCDPVAGGGLNDRQVISDDDPQRPSHRQMPYHGVTLVQLVLEVGRDETRASRPQRKKGRGGIGGMQAYQSGGHMGNRIGEREKLPAY